MSYKKYKVEVKIAKVYEIEVMATSEMHAMDKAESVAGQGEWVECEETIETEVIDD